MSNDEDDDLQPIGYSGMFPGWTRIGPDSDDPIMQEYAKNVFLSGADFTSFILRIKVFVARGRLWSAYTLLLAGAGALVLLSLNAAEDSFTEALFIELGAGVTLFGVALIVFAIEMRRRWLLYALLIGLSLAFGFTSHALAGPLQSYLLEACVGLLMILALDFGFKRFEAHALMALKTLKEEKMEHEDLVWEAENS